MTNIETWRGEKEISIYLISIKDKKDVKRVYFHGDYKDGYILLNNGLVSKELNCQQFLQLKHNLIRIYGNEYDIEFMDLYLEKVGIFSTMYKHFAPRKEDSIDFEDIQRERIELDDILQGVKDIKWKKI